MSLLRLTKTKFGTYVRNLLATNEQVKKQIRNYHAFAYLCKTQPKKFRMHWRGRTLVQEEYREGSWQALWDSRFYNSISDVIVLE